MRTFIYFFTNCQKEVEIQINGNKTPKYDDVPTIHVENYINRLFIDLLGREPTDTERDSLTKKLKDSQLSTLCRDSIVRRFTMGYHLQNG